ncbi:MAG: adenosylmethionine decarboxylase [Gammaproteobacteria bacterium]|nr:adenosylmethionine decarboxylase [Gammaproteobacteria bacterium]MBU1442449.1 adenosylmethionine decarboxylase [Gammaproteobacteria bacterium]MBU2287757.1 adenosylmethionine decarboxylase [Gammaproteobacteria bacterium]
MHGLHLTADLRDCRCATAWLTDAEQVGSACVEAARTAGLHVVGQLFHEFPATPEGPGGVTAAVLLAESHLCVHTWPERCCVTLDVYVCNFGGDHSAKAAAVLETLEALFMPGAVHRNALERGEVAAAAESR